MPRDPADLFRNSSREQAPAPRAGNHNLLWGLVIVIAVAFGASHFKDRLPFGDREDRQEQKEQETPKPAPARDWSKLGFLLVYEGQSPKANEVEIIRELPGWATAKGAKGALALDKDLPQVRKYNEFALGRGAGTNYIALIQDKDVVDVLPTPATVAEAKRFFGVD